MKIELTEEQKQFVLDNWDSMSFMQLTQKAFNDPELDGRSYEGKAIKSFLGGKQPRTSQWEVRPEIELTEENKEFIRNNLQLRPIEIGRIIFKNPRIEPLSKPVVSIKKYKESLNSTEVPSDEQDLPDDLYRPPTHLVHVVKKVNDFCQKDFKFEEMATVQKKSIESLRGFLHSPRFIQMINAYVSNKSRQIFESEFVRSTWDKPDLTTDELNLYVNLCANFVLMITIQRHLDLLNQRYERDVTNEEKNVSQALAEMIKAKTDELNKCDKRQSELIKDLNGRRADRIKNQKGSAASVANLISWFRDEEDRKKALHWAELRRKEVEEELDRIESFDEMTARILGLSRSELLNG